MAKNTKQQKTQTANVKACTSVSCIYILLYFYLLILNEKNGLYSGNQNGMQGICMATKQMVDISSHGLINYSIKINFIISILLTGPNTKTR